MSGDLVGTITIGVEDKIEKKFRITVREVVGTGKGTLGKAVSEAMQMWVNSKEQEEISKAAVERLEKGYDLGRMKYKNREELHERD